MAVMQLWMCRKCFPLGMYQIWAKYGTNVQQRSHLVPLRWVGPRTSAASFDLDFHHHCSSVSKKKQYTWVSLWRWTRRQCWGWWQGGQGFRGTRSGLGGSTIYLIFLSMLSMFGVNVLWVYSSVFAWGIFEYLGSRPSTQSCFSAAKDTEIILINENGVVK